MNQIVGAGKGIIRPHTSPESEVKHDIHLIQLDDLRGASDKSVFIIRYLVKDRTVVITLPLYAIARYGKENAFSILFILGIIHVDIGIGQSVWRGEKDMILFLMNTDYDPAKNVRLQLASPMRLERLETNGVWSEVGFGSEYVIPELGDFDCAVFRMTPMTHETA